MTFAILLLVSCNKIQTGLEFEKSVANEIFPALLDSLHYDRRLDTLPPPPPPENIQEKDATKIEWDESRMLSNLKNVK